MVVEVEMPQEEKFYLASVYVPAEREERGKFLQDLPDELPHQWTFLAGDINMIADPTMDRTPPRA